MVLEIMTRNNAIKLPHVILDEFLLIQNKIMHQVSQFIIELKNFFEKHLIRQSKEKIFRKRQ